MIAIKYLFSEANISLEIVKSGIIIPRDSDRLQQLALYLQ
jgi:hypothetical protein